jgi:peptidoglycan hydrolase-like protein with peptidoglycan-binding domain
MSNPTRPRGARAARLAAMVAAASAAVVVAVAAPASARVGAPTLHSGSRGTGVLCVQAAVGATVDGIYGPRTVQAVKVFQHRNHLRADGIVGPKTGDRVWAVDRAAGYGGCYRYVPTTR